MNDDLEYDVLLSHSAKDMALVRPLAERLRQDGPPVKAECRRQKSFILKSFILHSPFFLLPSLGAPIKGTLAHFLYGNGWTEGGRRVSIAANSV